MKIIFLRRLRAAARRRVFILAMAGMPAWQKKGVCSHKNYPCCLACPLNPWPEQTWPPGAPPGPHKYCTGMGKKI